MDMTMQMMAMHMKDMPMQGMDMTVMQECMEAGSACAAACTMCADSMMGESESVARSMCATMADLAGTMMRAMMRPTGMHAESMMAMHLATMTMANACAAECQKHADRSEDARMCAEACRQCAEASRKTMDLMKGMMTAG